MTVAPHACGLNPLEAWQAARWLARRGLSAVDGHAFVRLPFTCGRRGLPLGLQMVGRWSQHHRLLAAAHWSHERLSR